MEKQVESAAMVLSKISRSHLECSICHEKYQAPKLLDCLHSFCERCLVAYKKSTAKSSDMMPCPVCRKETKLSSDGIPGLRTNFHLMGMVDDFTLQEKLTQQKSFKLLCELCQDQPKAEFRCMDCPFFLCVNCREVHRRIAATTHHDVLALDALRSGTVSLRSKVKDEPPCEKHRGEKMRFYCETCKELICRDCTVVEHRESEHKFTTVHDAASRFRKATQERIVKVKESLTAHKETQVEMTKMADQLNKTDSLSHQQVIDQANEEGSKIAERESNIRKDLSRRKKFRLKTLQINGISFTKSRPQESKSTESSSTAEENMQKYSQSLEDKFAKVDKALVTLGQNVETLIKTDQDMHSVIDSLNEEALKDANDDRSKAAASKDKLSSQIQSTYDLRQQVIKELAKMTDAQIQRLSHALDTASDVVKSASDVDFLNLHSVIDSDLQNLLEESPANLHPGYPKIEFKSSDDTGLGELVVGATWKWEKDMSSAGNYLVRNFCAFTSGSKVLVRTDGGLCVWDTTNSSKTGQGVSGERIAMFPDNAFVSMDSSYVRLYDLNSSSPKSQFNLPSTIKQDGSDNDTTLGQPISIAHYKDKLLVIGYTNWQGVLVHDSSDGKVIHQLPISIKPDFLTSTSHGRMLVAARSPAVIEVIDSRGDAVVTIHPTVEGVPEGKQVGCVGMCRDKRDTIYVALLIDGESKVHVHQYSPYANFLGCSILDISPPVCGIAVTEEDRLVLAENYKMKVYETKD
ncbi:uncharacterized protein LOC119731818 [Patiria miniata]|uniref:Uncharacterized protein n=1 Tax=Patiria miniata TaxID=46514 RepID=A0A914AB93_PATMI|nr:uncharacterized protein LOC119731818 [Patiria miniata]